MIRQRGLKLCLALGDPAGQAQKFPWISCRQAQKSLVQGIRPAKRTVEVGDENDVFGSCVHAALVLIGYTLIPPNQPIGKASIPNFGL